MSNRKQASLLCAAAAAAVVAATGSAGWAADVVSLNAGSLPAGALASWPNAGTAGGTFNSAGTGTPTVTTVNGVNAVQFNNVEGGGAASDYFVSSFASPITGNANRTIEVWVFNPTVGSEETLVHNGRRGGPDGTNNSFNYGNDNRWGAHGAWGEPDMGWDGTPGSGAGGAPGTDTAPAAGQWHQLVYTYQNGHQRVYSDGRLENSENFALNTHADSRIRIAAQEQHDAASPGPAGPHILGLNGAIARVRVADTGTSARDVANAYNAQSGAFGQAARAAANSPLPRNRYEFNGNANDSIGGANAQVQSLGAPAAPTFTGGQLNLNNSGSDAVNGNYVELPDNVLDGLTASATLEFWGTWGGGNQWQRSVDLGRDTAEYAFIAPSSGAAGSEGDANAFEIKDEAGGSFAGTRRIASGETPVGQEVQFVAVFDQAANSARYYIDGTLVDTVALDGFNLDNLGDDNNWLGRSKFAADALLSGSINEFRIYNQALTDAQVFGNFLAGPDNLNLVPEPGSLGLLGLGGALLLRRRRPRD